MTTVTIHIHVHGASETANPSPVINNIYVDGVKEATDTATAEQTKSTSRSSSFYDMQRPIA